MYFVYLEVVFQASRRVICFLVTFCRGSICLVLQFIHLGFPPNEILMRSKEFPDNDREVRKTKLDIMLPLENGEPSKAGVQNVCHSVECLFNPGLLLPLPKDVPK